MSYSKGNNKLNPISPGKNRIQSYYSQKCNAGYVFTETGLTEGKHCSVCDVVLIEPDEDGYYHLPKSTDTVIVTAEGAVKDDSAPGGKLSFWELLIRFFRKIIAFSAAPSARKTEQFISASL